MKNDGMGISSLGDSPQRAQRGNGDGKGCSAGGQAGRGRRVRGRAASPRPPGSRTDRCGGLGQTALPETHLRAFVSICGWMLGGLGAQSKIRIGDISLAKDAKGAKKY